MRGRDPISGGKGEGRGVTGTGWAKILCSFLSFPAPYLSYYFPVLLFPVLSFLYFCILTCLKHAWRYVERLLGYQCVTSGAVFSSLAVSAMMKRLHALHRHASGLTAGQWFDVFGWSSVRTFRRCCCQVREVLCAFISSVYLNETVASCLILLKWLWRTVGAACHEN
jgi:hypothetical protein